MNGKLENIFKKPVEQNGVKTNPLAYQFQQISRLESIGDKEAVAFKELETILNDSGFLLGDATDVMKVFYNDSLLCRSESFTKVIDLLEEDSAIDISNDDKHANMCIMASGVGFKTAMEEGFSGRDVGGSVKVVVSFSGDNLTERSSLSNDDSLWETKAQTARVSLVGTGEIKKEDVIMISFRFPVKYFPSDQLREEEKDWLDEEKIKFIVRHYVTERKETAH